MMRHRYEKAWEDTTPFIREITVSLDLNLQDDAPEESLVHRLFHGVRLSSLDNQINPDLPGGAVKELDD